MTDAKNDVLYLPSPRGEAGHGEASMNDPEDKRWSGRVPSGVHSTSLSNPSVLPLFSASSTLSIRITISKILPF